MKRELRDQTLSPYEERALLEQEKREWTEEWDEIKFVAISIVVLGLGIPLAFWLLS